MKPKFLPGARHRIWSGVTETDWCDWSWQMRQSLQRLEDFAEVFSLTESEREGLRRAPASFRVSVTPYYASLASVQVPYDPIRKIFMPSHLELEAGHQQMLDPLGETQNLKGTRVVHRYSDRALLWVTDSCSVYCRYCTRKHFTAQGHGAASNKEYDEALTYIKSHKGIREVILSGGDPLTLGDAQLVRVLSDVRSIEHVEIIRIGTRMPVVNPMRITQNLVQQIKKFNPVFMMVHFNHPRELTREAFESLTLLVDGGLPVMNQMVLLNGVNNHAALVQALSRRLMLARVKPYYMFQCDPSLGTDHLRTSVENSLTIQRELWGHLSGLAMPTLSIDIPNGGGKTTLVPNFQTEQIGNVRRFCGWDGVEAEYVSPLESEMLSPLDVEEYLEEWRELQTAKLPELI